MLAAALTRAIFSGGGCQRRPQPQGAFRLEGLSVLAQVDRVRRDQPIAHHPSGLRLEGVASAWADRANPRIGVAMTRMYIDCREMPSESNCDLAMAGSEQHVVEAAAIHAVRAHGHEDTPELRQEIRQSMKEEVPGALA